MTDTAASVYQRALDLGDQALKLKNEKQPIRAKALYRLAYLKMNEASQDTEYGVSQLSLCATAAAFALEASLFPEAETVAKRGIELDKAYYGELTENQRLSARGNLVIYFQQVLRAVEEWRRAIYYR